MIGNEENKNSTPAENKPPRSEGKAPALNGAQGEEQYPNYQRRHYSGDSDRGYQGGDRPRNAAMEVQVDHNIDKAMKILKRKLIKEGLFKELKSRRYFEKPSERKKRKEKESLKKARKEEARNRKNQALFS